jgi:hypothetical protein
VVQELLAKVMQVEAILVAVVSLHPVVVVAPAALAGKVAPLQCLVVWAVQEHLPL